MHVAQKLVSAFNTAFDKLGVKVPRLKVASAGGIFTPKKKPKTKRQYYRRIGNILLQYRQILTRAPYRRKPWEGLTAVCDPAVPYRPSTLRNVINLVNASLIVASQIALSSGNKSTVNHDSNSSTLIKEDSLVGGRQEPHFTQRVLRRASPISVWSMDHTAIWNAVLQCLNSDRLILRKSTRGPET